MAMREAARVLGVTLQFIGVQEASDFAAAFTAISGGRPDALFVHSDGLMAYHWSEVHNFALRHRLPTMVTTRDVVAAGGLMSYAPSDGRCSVTQGDRSCLPPSCHRRASALSS